MIKIDYMKPFRTKVLGCKLHLTFAYQYFSVTKEDEAFYFIPIESKEIIFDMNKMQIENLSDVFVFQRGNRFIRLPLYQLSLVSNMFDFLLPIVNDFKSESKEGLVDTELVSNMSEGVLELIAELEKQNLIHAIDMALDSDNKIAFKELSDAFNNLLTKS